MTGRLVLVATPIGNLGDLSPRAVEVLRAADVIGCEDTRHTRKLLTHAGIEGPRLVAVHDHNEPAMARRLCALVEDGRTVALVTDAGMPGIADPGARVVASAAAMGLRVEVVPGASAALAALVVSGLDTQRFCFEGFLPRKGKERAARLAAVAADDRTTVLFEAPHRIARTVTDLAEACGPTRAAAIVRELTKLHENVWRGSLAAAVDHVAAAEPRGEYVIVVAGAPPLPDPSDDDVRRAVAERLAAGRRTREAVDDVAVFLRIPRRRAYELAVDLQTSAADAAGTAGVTTTRVADADAGDDVGGAITP